MRKYAEKTNLAPENLIPHPPSEKGEVMKYGKKSFIVENA
jgi:hypothetical protein